MNKTCEPIRDKKKITSFLNLLRGTSERNYLVAKFQMNTGLRISDVVPVKVSDLCTPNLAFKEYFALREQKTRNRKNKREKKIRINDELKNAIRIYIKSNHLLYEDYLFGSRKSDPNGLNRPISTTQAYRVLRDAAEELGLEHFGTHSFRKTWGFWSYKESQYNIALIQDTFDHDSPKDTLRYIGINQDDKDYLYSVVQF